MKKTVSVQVTVTRIIDWTFPVFGEFELICDFGVALFHEKLPVVGVEIEAGAEFDLPMGVLMECTAVSTTQEGTVIDTSLPHRIEDTCGRTRFLVQPEIISSINR